MRGLPDEKVLSRYTSTRTQQAERRAQATLKMIRLLPSEQRLLTEMVIVNRQSLRAAAAKLRLRPGAVSRRVQQIRNRLACPIRRALAEHLDTLPEKTRGLAIEHFFGGVPRTILARNLNLSLREVQAQLDYVCGWLRALNRRRLAERKELVSQLDD